MKTADDSNNQVTLRIPGKCLNEADDKELYAGLEKYGGTKNRQARIDFCLGYLDEIKSGKKGDPQESRQLARAALVRWYLSSDLVRTLGEEAAIAQLSEGLDEAAASGYHDVQYYCLKSMGGLLSVMGKNEEALRYFQMSLFYSWTFLPTQFLASLQAMANAWSRPDTIEMAAMAFDWMLLIEPKSLHTLHTKFKALARNGKIDSVKELASAGPGKTCENHAICAAANYALDFFGEAEEVAQAGLRLAKRLSDPEWKSQFTGFIKQVSAVQTRKSEHSKPDDEAVPNA